MCRPRERERTGRACARFHLSNGLCVVANLGAIHGEDGVPDHHPLLCRTSYAVWGESQRHGATLLIGDAGSRDVLTLPEPTHDHPISMNVIDHGDLKPTPLALSLTHTQARLHLSLCICHLYRLARIVPLNRQLGLHAWGAHRSLECEHHSRRPSATPAASRSGLAAKITQEGWTQKRQICRLRTLLHEKYLLCGNTSPTCTSTAPWDSFWECTATPAARDDEADTTPPSPRGSIDGIKLSRHTQPPCPSHSPAVCSNDRG